MFLEKPAKAHSRAKRASVEFEEERAWVSFYAQVARDVTVAAEVLAQLDADPQLKRDRLALYLRCKESMRSHKARQVRNRRIGQAIRLVFHWLLVRPGLALRGGLQQACSVAIECLPETVRETAATQTPRLRRDPDQVRATSACADHGRRPAMVGAAPDAGIAEPGVPRTKAASNAA